MIEKLLTLVVVIFLIKEEECLFGQFIEARLMGFKLHIFTTLSVIRLKV